MWFSNSDDCIAAATLSVSCTIHPFFALCSCKLTKLIV